MKQEDEEQMKQEHMMQQINQQMNQLQEYLDQLEKSLIELEILKKSVAEFGNMKKGDKIHAPLANGIFVEATLDNSSKLLVNVGEGVVLKKSIPETIKLLEKQEKEIISSKEQIQKKMDDFYSEFQTVN